MTTRGYKGSLFLFASILLLAAVAQGETEVVREPNEGTAAMMKILDDVAAKMDPNFAVYDIYPMVEVLEAAVAAGMEEGEVDGEQFMRLASLLPKAGRPQEALLMIDFLITSNVFEDANDGYFALAEAAIRVGEDMNWILSHSPDSSLLPIAGNGIYTERQWTESAFTLLKKLMDEPDFSLIHTVRYLIYIMQQTVATYESALTLPQFVSDGEISEKMSRFYDVAGEHRVTSRSSGGLAVMDDFNNDGFLDIVTGGHLLGEKLNVFLNDRQGSFVDVTSSSTVGDLDAGLRVEQADYDNDGCLDLLILRGAWRYPFEPEKAGISPNSLLRGRCDGTFDDVSIAAGIDPAVRKATSAGRFVDLNQDGWVDIVLANEFDYPDLYINKGDGTFFECAEAAGLHDGTDQWHKAVGVVDMNGDGLPDIIFPALELDLGTDVECRVFLQQASEGEGSSGVVGLVPSFRRGDSLPPHSTFNMLILDLDNDGDEDIINLSFYYYTPAMMADELRGIPPSRLSDPHAFINPQVLLSDGAGGYIDATEEYGLSEKVLSTMGYNFGDLDNDGYLDLYLGSGEHDLVALIPNRMFISVEGKKFVDASVVTGTSNLQKGHSVAMGDVDNDGDLDIYAQLGGSYPGDAYFNALYENPGTSYAPVPRDHRWLTLKLEGLGGGRTNRAAIGSRIRVTVREEDDTVRHIFRTVPTSGCYGASSLQEEVGLGAAVQVEEVRVTWADGKASQSVFRDLQLDSFYLLTEGSETAEQQLRPAVELKGHADA